MNYNTEEAGLQRCAGAAWEKWEDSAHRDGVAEDDLAAVGVVVDAGGAFAEHKVAGFHQQREGGGVVHQHRFGRGVLA